MTSPNTKNTISFSNIVNESTDVSLNKWKLDSITSDTNFNYQISFRNCEESEISKNKIEDFSICVYELHKKLFVDAKSIKYKNIKNINITFSYL